MLQIKSEKFFYRDFYGVWVWGSQFGRVPLEKGYSFVELLIVIAVLGLLLGFGSVGIAEFRNSWDRMECLARLQQLHLVKIAFTLDNLGFVCGGEITEEKMRKVFESYFVSGFVGVDQNNLNWDLKRALFCPKTGVIFEGVYDMYRVSGCGACGISPSDLEL